MVIREWRGRTKTARSGEYPRHFRDRVIPELRRLDGFLGASLSRRQVGETVEFLVLTRWGSMDAIRAFAGENVERAVVEPGAVAALDAFDAEVRHYEVVEEARGPGPVYDTIT